MTTSFIQKERQRIFRDLTRQYQQEGYDLSESKSLAKREVDEIMLDKEGFVSELWDSSYEE